MVDNPIKIKVVGYPLEQELYKDPVLRLPNTRPADEVMVRSLLNPVEPQVSLLWDPVSGDFQGGQPFAAVGHTPSRQTAPFADAAAEVALPPGNPRPVSHSNNQVADQPPQKPEIEHLVKLAEEAYRNSRYTLPPKRSAIHYYRNIQRIDPDNSMAEAGIAQIAARYHELSKRQLKQKKFKLAKRFVKRGLYVKPDSPTLKKLRRQIVLAEAEHAAARKIERELALKEEELKALSLASNRMLRQRRQSNAREQGFFGRWRSTGDRQVYEESRASFGVMRGD